MGCYPWCAEGDDYNSLSRNECLCRKYRWKNIGSSKVWSGCQETITLVPGIITPKPNGLYRCTDVRCKLCRLYIQECTSFVTSKGTTWEIRSHITCNAHNALYYLKCPWCEVTTKTETYTGRAVILRGRMNTHISCCKLGTGTDLFDKHVFECRKKHPNSTEPWFQYVFKDQRSEYVRHPWKNICID